MGLGGTAKKIQLLAEKAEQMYEKLNELRTEVERTQDTVNGTAERVQRLEVEMAEQRAVLDAVAEEIGVDLETVSTDAHIQEAEFADEDGQAGTVDADGTGDGDAPDADGETSAGESSDTDGTGNGEAAADGTGDGEASDAATGE